MNSIELHGPECTCNKCTFGEVETIIDLTGTVAKKWSFYLKWKNSLKLPKIIQNKRRNVR